MGCTVLEAVVTTLARSTRPRARIATGRRDAETREIAAMELQEHSKDDNSHSEFLKVRRPYN